MIHFFDTQTLPVSRWRNGRGETREIVSFPPSAEAFSWRISVATIAQDGDFSQFPGIDRVITLLDGGGVELNARGKYQQLLLHNQPFIFAGEDEITSRLIGDVSRDFNVMTRRETHQAEVRVVKDPLSPTAETAGVAYVLAGEWMLGDLRLQQGQGVWWSHNGEPLAPRSAEAELLFTEIKPTSVG